MATKLLSADEAAELLNVSARRVRQFAEQGRLGMRVGGTWVFEFNEVKRFAAIERRRGRPSKSDA